MSAHRLIRCLSPCRESALVRYKATRGNPSLSPKHLVWQSGGEEEKERLIGGERERIWGKEKRGKSKVEGLGGNTERERYGITEWGIDEERAESLFQPGCTSSTVQSDILLSPTVSDSLALLAAVQLHPSYRGVESWHKRYLEQEGRVGEMNWERKRRKEIRARPAEAGTRAAWHRWRPPREGTAACSRCRARGGEAGCEGWRHL